MSKTKIQSNKRSLSDLLCCFEDIEKNLESAKDISEKIEIPFDVSDIDHLILRNDEIIDKITTEIDEDFKQQEGENFFDSGY